MPNRPYTDKERVRLIQLLGMLGTVFDGERASIAKKIDDIVQGIGRTWAELIVPISVEPRAEEPRRASPKPESDSQKSRPDAYRNWRDAAAC